MLARMLRTLRSEHARTPELERVVTASLGVLDRTLFEAAVEIARDQGAGHVARIQSFRILLSQVDPTSPPEYEELTAGRLSALHFDWGPTHGEPLPSGYIGIVLNVADSVVSGSSEGDVREAAEVVRSAARIALRRRQSRP